jgi:hypothetical protein
LRSLSCLRPPASRSVRYHQPSNARCQTFCMANPPGKVPGGPTGVCLEENPSRCSGAGLRFVWCNGLVQPSP